MRLAADVREFWRDPRGLCIAGRRHLFFCAHLELWGCVAWGDLDATEVSALGAFVVSLLGRDVSRHASYVDLRDVTSVDASAYVAMTDLIGEHGARLSSMIARMALARPRGIVGAIAEGISTQVAFPHPFEVFEEAEDAFAFVGAEDGSLARELEAICERVKGVPPLLQSVRALLEARPGRVPLAGAAKAVGLAPRTLQRSLAEAGTSFQLEVNRAQVAVAQRLLADREAKLSTIAIEVGCPSLQHFSTMFRRMTGMAPSVWRRENLPSAGT